MSVSEKNAVQTSLRRYISTAQAHRDSTIAMALEWRSDVRHCKWILNHLVIWAFYAILYHQKWWKVKSLHEKDVNATNRKNFDKAAASWGGNCSLLPPCTLKNFDEFRRYIGISIPLLPRCRLWGCWSGRRLDQIVTTEPRWGGHCVRDEVRCETARMVAWNTQPSEPWFDKLTSWIYASAVGNMIAEHSPSAERFFYLSPSLHLYILDVFRCMIVPSFDSPIHWMIQMFVHIQTIECHAGVELSVFPQRDRKVPHW